MIHPAYATLRIPQAYRNATAYNRTNYGTLGIYIHISGLKVIYPGNGDFVFIVELPFFGTHFQGVPQCLRLTGPMRPRPHK
jgi:hypothetical protein